MMVLVFPLIVTTVFCTKNHLVCSYTFDLPHQAINFFFFNFFLSYCTYNAVLVFFLNLLLFI